MRVTILLILSLFCFFSLFAQSSNDYIKESSYPLRYNFEDKIKDDIQSTTNNIESAKKNMIGFGLISIGSYATIIFIDKEIGNLFPIYIASLVGFGGSLLSLTNFTIYSYHKSHRRHLEKLLIQSYPKTGYIIEFGLTKNGASLSINF